MGFLQHSYLQLLNILIAALSECKDERKSYRFEMTRGHPAIGSLRSPSPMHLQGGDVSISCQNTTPNSNTFRIKLHRTKPDNSVFSFSFPCKWCKVLKPVWTTAKSSVTLSCPELLNVNWEVVRGDQSTEITKYLCKHSETTEGVMKPLCERSKRNKTSLIIRDVVHSDALWFRCRGNKTCHDVKLHVKGLETPHLTLSTVLSTTVRTDATVSAVSYVDQMEDSMSFTVAVASVLSVCIISSLIICVILYLKKRKSKTTTQIDFSRNSLYFTPDSVYYSQISEGLQFPLYHVLEDHTEAFFTTFGDKQTQAAA